LYIKYSIVESKFKAQKIKASELPWRHKYLLWRLCDENICSNPTCVCCCKFCVKYVVLEYSDISKYSQCLNSA